jgi:hypothetical protein
MADYAPNSVLMELKLQLALAIFLEIKDNSTKKRYYIAYTIVDVPSMDEKLYQQSNTSIGQKRTT